MPNIAFLSTAHTHTKGFLQAVADTGKNQTCVLDLEIDVFFVDGFIIHNRLLASRLGEGGRYSIHVASGKKNGL